MSVLVRAGRMAAMAVALVALGSVAPLAAQGGGPGGGGQMGAARQQELVDSVTTGLNLEGDMAKKVSDLILGELPKRQEAMQAMMSGGGGMDRAAMTAKTTEIAEATEKELAKMLSADQMTKYKEIRTAWQARAPQRRPNPGS